MKTRIYSCLAFSHLNHRTPTGVQSTRIQRVFIRVHLKTYQYHDLHSLENADKLGFSWLNTKLTPHNLALNSKHKPQDYFYVRRKWEFEEAQMYVQKYDSKMRKITSY